MVFSMYYGNGNGNQRKLKPAERTLDKTASKTEKLNQAYFDHIIKHVPSGLNQAGHNPYQCDIKLK